MIVPAIDVLVVFPNSVMRCSLPNFEKFHEI